MGSKSAIFINFSENLIDNFADQENNFAISGYYRHFICLPL